MIDCKSDSLANRRRFLASAAGAIALPTVLSASEAKRSANDRLQIGVIGLGSRGYNLIDALIGHQDSAQIVAICDVDSMHYRDRAWKTGTAFGLTPAKQKIEQGYAKGKSAKPRNDLRSFTDFRELIEQDGIDAVVVATPDHWHALCTLTALQAGKDVYCEKPVTHLFREGQMIYREVEKRQPTAPVSGGGDGG